MNAELNTPGRMSSAFMKDLPLVGILRGTKPSQLPHVVGTVVEAGLAHIEITMNSPGAREQIREARRIVGDAATIGAGTVTDLTLLDAALQAGATFIVTPTLNLTILQECLRLGIPVFPGAFSPTEIATAWDAGATMVKVFPADVLGPTYIKSVKAPLPHIELMPTGGVDLTTIDAFAKAGANAYGVGSPLFKMEKINAADWAWLGTECAAYVQKVRSFTKK